MNATWPFRHRSDLCRSDCLERFGSRSHTGKKIAFGSLQAADRTRVLSIKRSDMLTHRYHLLVLLWVFETASCVSLVTVKTQDLENKETLTCFKSADPGAVRATQLHGDHNDEGDLWSRDPNTSAPLPRCSSSSFSPLPSHCEVCLLEEVYMICDNLPAGTKLFLERPGTPFSTKESACPTLPPADLRTLPENNCCSSSGEKISPQFVFTLFFAYIRGHY